MLVVYKLFLLCIAPILNAEQTVIVDFELGKIEGSVLTSKSGFKIDAFLGIPYGKVPERFSKPVPVEPWKGVKQAKTLPSACIQTAIFGEGLFKMPDSEDCLYLNLFAPHETHPVTSYPVMVFIHGGGYQLGSTLEYGTDGITEWIVPKGVVFINFHYRLGIWGFFSTGTKEANGNYGLWDQSLLLKWVKDNVAHFGGNPNKITVFGESAGSFSTSLQSLSPHSRDLFQNIILMSGSALAPWFVTDDSVNLSLEVAKHVGCITTDNEKMLKCMRFKTDADIADGVKKLDKNGVVPHLFVPRIDNDFFPYLTIEKLLQASPPKPTIIGCTNEEMGFFVTPITSQITTLWTIKDPNSFTTEQMRKNMRDIIEDLQYPDLNLIIDLAMNHYVGSHGSRENGTFLTHAYTEFLSDLFFIAPAIKEAHLRMKSGSKVWLYEMDYFNPTFASGSFHFYDLLYIFKMGIFHINEFTEEELKVAEYYTTLFTNFAKFGNPTESDVGGVQWLRTNDEFPERYLKIATKLEMNNYMKRSAVAFWNVTLPRLQKHKPNDYKNEEDTQTLPTKREEL